MMKMMKKICKKVSKKFEKKLLISNFRKKRLFFIFKKSFEYY